MPEMWTTAKEIEFVVGLGTYSLKRYNHEGRLKLLEKYRKAAIRRLDWGDVKISKVIMAVDTEIEIERRRVNGRIAA